MAKVSVAKKRTPDEGLEPATLRFLARERLKVWCSTDWANRALLTSMAADSVAMAQRHAGQMFGCQPHYAKINPM